MSAHPFARLTPDLVLDAVESIGFLSDARVLALNRKIEFTKLALKTKRR